MLAQAVFDAQEDDALLFKVLLNAVIDHFRFILGANTCQEFALSLGDAQAIKGVFDGIGHIVPGTPLRIGGTHVVIDIVQVQAGNIGSPGWHGASIVVFQRPQAKFKHPFGFALQGRNLADDIAVEASARFENRGIWITKSVLIIG